MPARVSTAGVTFRLFFRNYDWQVGFVVEKVFAVTSEAQVTGRRYHDTAPQDDSGSLPKDAATPPAAPAIMILPRPFDFATFEPAGPLTARSVNGKPVRFEFDIAAHPSADATQFATVFYNLSKPWMLSSNFEADGAPLINGLGTKPTRLVLTVNSTRASEPGGQTVPLALEFYSSAHSYRAFEAAIEVVDRRYTDPDFVFTQRWNEPVRARSIATGTLHVSDAAGTARPGLPVGVELSHPDGGRGSMDVVTDSNGDADLSFDFPAAGPWTIEAYVMEAVPAPFGSSTLTVLQPAEDAPAPGPILFAVGTAFAALGAQRWHERSRRA